MQSGMSRPAPRWLLSLIFVALFFTLVRNLLPPNAFTATVLLFDYEFGLIRRGLVGEIANFFWGDTVSRTEVFQVALVLTLLGVAGSVALFFRRFPATQAGRLLLVLLLSSFAFNAIVASTGYIDLLLIALVCLALFANPARPLGVILRILACGVGMFAHEIMCISSDFI